jgi:hypothetical protein
VIKPLKKPPRFAESGPGDFILSGKMGTEKEVSAEASFNFTFFTQVALRWNRVRHSLTECRKKAPDPIHGAIIRAWMP